MKNRQSAPLALSKSVCVIEVCRDRNDPPKFLQCLISIPGHPGMFNRNWPLGGRLLDAVQARDLALWVTKTVTSAISVSVGIQEVLDETS